MHIINLIILYTLDAPATRCLYKFVCNFDLFQLRLKSKNLTITFEQYYYLI